MTEMTRRGRTMAATRGERADRFPFNHHWVFCQLSQAERECRNRGMGIIWLRPCYVERLHEVEVSERSAVSSRGETVVRRTYTTPVGSVYLDEKREAGSGSWHADLGWTGMSPWLTARLIKEPEDYEVVKREFPISTRSGQHTP